MLSFVSRSHKITNINKRRRKSARCLFPDNPLYEIEITRYICVNTVRIGKATELSERCYSNDLVHAVRLVHDNLTGESNDGKRLILS